MSCKFIRYDAKGQIHATGFCNPDHLDLQNLEGYTLREVNFDVSYLTDYIDLTTFEILPRPPGPTSLLDLPVPCTVTVKSLSLNTEETYEVDDGVFEYDDLPGSYQMTVKSFPALESVIEVTL